MKKILSILLSSLLLLSVLQPGMIVFADDETSGGETVVVEEQSGEEISETGIKLEYADKDGIHQEASIALENKIDASYAFRDSALQSGWYCVEGNVTVADRITISGDVHLILTDGCNIVFNKGIQLISGNALTIYSQTNVVEAMPHLYAYGHDYDAAIGTRGQDTAGTFTLIGGNITATSDKGAGVGGGRAYEGFDWANNGPDGGTVNIYNGILSATSNGASAGIGGGQGGYNNNAGVHYTAPKGGDGGTLNIYGGAIHAKSSGWQAIGSGKYGTKKNNPDGQPGKPTTVNNYASSLEIVGRVNEDKEVSIAEICTVTIDYMNSAFKKLTYTVSKGNRIQLPDTKTLPGKTIYNWCYDAECTRAFDFTSAILNDTTLYANWKDDIKVTFNYQDEVTESETFIIPYGSKIARPTDPARDGYTIIDWYDGPDADGANRFDFFNPCTKDEDLYAIWMKDPIVTFVYGQGIENELKTVKYNGYVTLPEKIVSKMVALEWYYDSELNSRFYAKTPIKEDITLYPKWQEGTTYINSNGDYGIIKALTGVINSDFIFENNEIMSGWYEVEGNVEIQDRITISGDVNLVLMDGSNIKFNNGIKLMSGNSLAVYSETLDKDNMGKLEAYGHDYNAAIGTNGENTAGTFTLCGGEVIAMSDNGAGIGGGLGYGGNGWANGGPSAGTVNVYNGILRAATKGKSAAIGGGKGGSMGNWGNSTPAANGGSGGVFNYYGGSIYAGSEGWQAIGGGCGGDKNGATSGNPGPDAVVKLMAEANVKGEFNKDKLVEVTPAGSGAASVFANGGIIAPAAIAAIVIGIIAAIVIKKKKSQQ